jgi:hypothetical protein
VNFFIGPMYLFLNFVLQGLTFGYLILFRNVLTWGWTFMTLFISTTQFGIYFAVFLMNPGLATFSGMRAPNEISYAQKR